MNKFLKLTGVSMLAIMTASGANAAGYTCEELIEYTSCNPGYYLSGSDCPDGYTYYSNICYAWGEYYPDMTEEVCMDEDEVADAEYMGAGCIDYNPDNYADDPDMDPGVGYDFVATSVRTCEQCPAGSICAGGDTAATACPAGSYCATTGLKEPTGKCAVGSYAASGATSCMSCPSTGLTDINGAVVNATTLSTGSTSVSACIVGSESQFKDTKGTYHFKSDCSFSASIATPDGCEILGGTWDDFSGDCSGVDGSVNPGKDFVYEDGMCKSLLDGAGSEYIEENGGSVSWNGEFCECSGTWWYTDQEVILYCQE